jgi:hypothetical protein
MEIHSLPESSCFAEPVSRIYPQITQIPQIKSESGIAGRNAELQRSRAARSAVGLEAGLRPAPRTLLNLRNLRHLRHPDQRGRPNGFAPAIQVRRWD